MCRKIRYDIKSYKLLKFQRNLNKPLIEKESTFELSTLFRSLGRIGIEQTTTHNGSMRLYILAPT